MSPSRQVLSNPRITPSGHARAPHPRPPRCASRVRPPFVVAQASIFTGQASLRALSDGRLDGFELSNMVVAGGAVLGAAE